MNMNFITKQTIQMKIFVISFFAVFFLSLLAIGSLYSSHQVEENFESLKKNELFIARTTKIVLINIGQLNKLSMYLAVTNDGKEKNLKQMKKHHNIISKHLKNLRDRIKSQNNKNLDKLIKYSIMRYTTYSSLALNLHMSIKDDYEEGIEQIYALHSISQKMHKELKTLAQTSRKNIDKEFEKIYQIIKINAMMFASFAIIAIILFIISSRVIYKSILRSIYNFQEGLTSYFNYLQDSSKKVKFIRIDAHDEIDQMAQTVNRSIRTSVKLHKKIERFNENLEKEVALRTIELDDEKELIKSIMNAQVNLVITTDGKSIKTANKAFLDFYSVSTIAEFVSQYGECICDTFDTKSDESYIKKLMNDDTWADYILKRPTKTHKTIIIRDGVEHIFGINIDSFIFKEEKLITVVLTDITTVENYGKEIELMYQNTKDSIEYSALIQSAILPDQNKFRTFFKDSFALWQPKDVVGGDIYLFETLRHEDECLMMCIDCTGHGVPGAFVTMLVKSIERELVASLKKSDYDVNPSIVLSHFNKEIKKLLHQHDDNSFSNAGFDGGIIYVNKREKVLKYAGAYTELFYTHNNEVNMIKGNKHSVGYVKSDPNYTFTTHTIDIEDGMKFYVSSDGYIDQKGGEKGFSFGKRRFKNLIEEWGHENFTEQKEVFILEMAQYQGDYFKVDDVTLLGWEI